MRQSRILPIAALLCAGLSGCDRAVEPVAVPPLPERLSNLAVASVTSDAGTTLYTFYGLGAGKTHEAIGRHAYAITLSEPAWRRLADVPVEYGRLAAAATNLGGKIYLVGGYTVAADGSEASMPEMLRFDAAKGAFDTVGVMLTAVDDTVMLPWADQYLLFISGWHDNRNVRAVQTWDSAQGVWLPPSIYPGKGVFGHAGGIVGDTLVVCDGVLATRNEQGTNVFAMNDECWQGKLDRDAPGSIAWTALPAHPGKPRYRMAAAGTLAHGARVVFVGGSENSYNYDGMGYDGKPASASAAVFSWNIEAQRWDEHAPAPVATMDHRALIERDGALYVIGGMRDPQSPTDQVMSFALSEPK